MLPVPKREGLHWGCLEGEPLGSQNESGKRAPKHPQIKKNTHTQFCFLVALRVIFFFKPYDHTSLDLVHSLVSNVSGEHDLTGIIYRSDIR